MIRPLRILFLLVLASMIGVTLWAGLSCPLLAVPREVYTHPWFIATLFDTYWAFITFYVWVAYKQTSWVARAAWFIAIMLLGNIAMSAFCLSELFQVPANGRLANIMTARRPGPSLLGLALAIAGTAILALAYGSNPR